MSKVGRPVKSVSYIKISDLVVEYLSTKPDDFNNEISYFKIMSPKLKMKPMLILNADLKVPVWKSDKGDYILKIKDKFIKTLTELVLKDTYIIDLDLVYYDMTGRLILKVFLVQFPRLQAQPLSKKINLLYKLLNIVLYTII